MQKTAKKVVYIGLGILVMLALVWSAGYYRNLRLNKSHAVDSEHSADNNPSDKVLQEFGADLLPLFSLPESKEDRFETLKILPSGNQVYFGYKSAKLGVLSKTGKVLLEKQLLDLGKDDSVQSVTLVLNNDFESWVTVLDNRSKLHVFKLTVGKDKVVVQHVKDLDVPAKAIYTTSVVPNELWVTTVQPTSWDLGEVYVDDKDVDQNEQKKIDEKIKSEKQYVVIINFEKGDKINMQKIETTADFVPVWYEKDYTVINTSAPLERRVVGVYDHKAKKVILDFKSSAVLCDTCFGYVKEPYYLVGNKDMGYSLMQVKYVDGNISLQPIKILDKYSKLVPSFDVVKLHDYIFKLGEDTILLDNQNKMLVSLTSNKEFKLDMLAKDQDAYVFDQNITGGYVDINLNNGTILRLYKD